MTSKKTMQVGASISLSTKQLCSKPILLLHLFPKNVGAGDNDIGACHRKKCVSSADKNSFFVVKLQQRVRLPSTNMKLWTLVQK